MAEVPELPEATNPFERTVALLIAILAVVLSLVDNKGDNAKTDAIVKTSKAANTWAYYQSKSLKENLAETGATLLSNMTDIALKPDARAQVEKFNQEVKRYDGEKSGIRSEAEALEAEVAAALAVDDECDLAALVLQFAVVLASISILVRWKAIFFASLAASAVGVVLGITALLM
jgi:hypothetical protein